MDITNPNVVEYPHNTGFDYEIYYNYFDREPYYKSMAINPHRYMYKPKRFYDDNRNLVEGFGFINGVTNNKVCLTVMILLILFIYFRVN